MNIRNVLMAAAAAVLAVVAIVGWTRKPSSQTAYPYPPTATTGTSAQPAYLDQNGQPINGSASRVPYSSQPVSASGAYVPNGAYPNGPYSSPATYQPAIYSTPAQDDGYVSQRYVRSIHRPVRIVRSEYVSSDAVARERDSVDRDNEYSNSSRGETVRTRYGRSKGKSVAIVAGSAGVGAAIGAIAGGGKGAGIGALAGGGAGFAYDRLTHNH